MTASPAQAATHRHAMALLAVGLLALLPLLAHSTPAAAPADTAADTLAATQLRYRYHHTGEWAAQVGDWLPDSLVVTITAQALEVRFYGPLAHQQPRLILRAQDDTLWGLPPDPHQSPTELLYAPVGTEAAFLYADSLVRQTGRATMMGYACTRYRNLLTTPQGPLRQDIALTTDLDVDLAPFRLDRLRGVFFFTRGMQGVPVRVATKLENPDLISIAQLDQVRTARLPAARFQIPQGVPQRRFSPNGPTPAEP